MAFLGRAPCSSPSPCSSAGKARFKPLGASVVRRTSVLIVWTLSTFLGRGGCSQSPVTGSSNEESSSYTEKNNSQLLLLLKASERANLPCSFLALAPPYNDQEVLEAMGTTPLFPTRQCWRPSGLILGLESWRVT